MANYFKLNNKIVPTPDRMSGLTLNNIDSSSSTRLENGFLYIKRIRTGISKIPMSWSYLTDSEAKQILDFIDNPDIVFMDVSFKHPHYGWVTRKMYAAGTSCSLSGRFWKITTTFIEQ